LTFSHSEPQSRRAGLSPYFPPAGGVFILCYAEKTQTLENATSPLGSSTGDTQLSTKTLAKFYLVVRSEGLPLLERTTCEKVQSNTPDDPALACSAQKIRADCNRPSRWQGPDDLATLSV